MKIMTTDTNRVFKLSLRYWSDSDHQWQPDCFDDLEVNFPADHDRSESDDSILCTQSELDALVDWWTDEVDGANNKPEYRGDVLVGRNVADYPMPDDDEWAFNVEEI